MTVLQGAATINAKLFKMYQKLVQNSPGGHFLPDSDQRINLQSKAPDYDPEFLFYIMFRLFHLIIFALLTIPAFSQQKRWVLDTNSVIRDSSGYQYKYKEWKPLLESKEFIAVAVDTTDPNTSFVIQRFTNEMREKWLAKSPRPRESAFFETGKKFPFLKAKTISGEKINTKDLKGKILVINYWFIDCMPCRREIPELNDLVKRFENDSNIVFISVAKDSKRDLSEFLDQTAFSYKIIANNVGGNGIASFPTNVVVNKDGNVVFHASGYSPFTIYWIRKSIEESKSSP